MSELDVRIAGVLLADAADLAARWCARAPVVAGVATRSTAERYSELSELIAEVVRGVAHALGGTAHAMLELAWAGWRFGTARFEAEAALHQVLQELHLMEAMVLHAAEQTVDAADPPGSAREGVAAARALQRGSALATLAAARGYTHAHLERQQHRFRMLRHDLRNPLGTIRNAIALLEDETMPEHLRDPERFRKIVSRNAQQADALVTRDLGDHAVYDAALAQQEVALGDVARAVRRALRAAAEAARTEIVVPDEMPVIRADLASLELVLLASVGAVLEAAESAENPGRVAIEVDAVEEKAVRVRISSERAPIAETEGIGLARDLTRWAGGELSIPDALVVELPTSPRDAGDDLAGASQG